MGAPRSVVKDHRWSRFVIAMATLPPISREGKWSDGIPERESPDGPPPAANAEPYPYDVIVAGTLRLRAGKPKLTKQGDWKRGRPNRMYMVNLYKRRGNRYHLAREFTQ